MAQYTITIKGIDKLIKDLDDAGTRKRLEKGVRRALLLYQAGIIKNLSGRVLKVRSGRLRQSIGVQVKSSGTGIEGSVGSQKVIYANVHEKGKVIKAKRAKYLTFKGKQGWVRKKKVKIPRRPFVKPEIKANAPQVRKVISEAFLGKLGKK